MENLKLEMRKAQYGAGIYVAGNSEKCYCRLFVTDSGRVMAVNGRVITEDDLLEVYSWGVQDTQEGFNDEGVEEPTDETSEEYPEDYNSEYDGADDYVNDPTL